MRSAPKNPANTAAWGVPASMAFLDADRARVPGDGAEIGRDSTLRLRGFPIQSDGEAGPDHAPRPKSDAVAPDQRGIRSGDLASARVGGKRIVKIEYDPEADALYIQIREAHPDDNIDIEEGVTVDVDEHGHIVGVEVLDASKRLSPSDLANPDNS